MIRRPPHGKTVFFSPGLAGCIVWEPGNGARYYLQATDVGDQIADHIGGRVMVALSSMADNTFVANAVNPDRDGHWTREYVRKKWQRIYGIGDHAEYLAMLMNWSLGSARACAYADEQWSKARGEDGKVVNLHERRIHR
jgi:hypothetical protein